MSIILGIDPGLGISGFAIAEKSNNSLMLLDYGYLQMSYKNNLEFRVSEFYDFFKAKIIKHKVTKLALETPFLGKNVQSFLKLGYLRGILYLLSSKHNLELFEFTPREVKRSVTGYGAASKEQVARTVLMLLPGLEKPKKDDVTDALAIMLCGLWKGKNSYL